MSQTARMMVLTPPACTQRLVTPYTGALRHRQTWGRVDSTVCCSGGTPHANTTALLTREIGKNAPLEARLTVAGFRCVELPLIEAVPGPDRPRLPDVLASTQFDWIVLTSPEAAAVYLEGWRAAGRPGQRIATVGPGTTRILDEAPEELSVSFTPSVANAEHLGAELPLQPSPAPTVMYPSSCRAATTLQAALGDRGFVVQRMNTYDTVAVKSFDPERLREASDADVVTVASPSAVKAWKGLAERLSLMHLPLACIGSTSARAAEKSGFPHVFHPEKPGLDGWTEAVRQATDSCTATA